MKHFLKQIIYLVPIIMLAGTLLCNFINFDYVLIGNILGYSILVNVVFIYHFHYGPYCWLTRYSPIGLLVINMIDILGCFINYGYYSKLFNICVCGMIFILALISWIKTRLAYD